MFLPYHYILSGFQQPTMAAYSTGASWGFDDLPGGWTNVESEDAAAAQLHEENERASRAEADKTARTEANIKSESGPPPQTETKQEEQQKKRTHYPPRTCRICLEVVLPTFHYDTDSPLPAALQPTPRVTYESPDGGRLLRPCKCKGSQKYVHEDCLGAWRMADPLQKRNYWECPTCRYRYRLQRLNWGSWISSTAAQIGLTVAIFFIAMFGLGFVADPIINLYLDPVSTIATAGGPTGSLIFENEKPTWGEHFAKGLASLGLLGFAKFLLTLSPWHWFNMRGTGIMGGGGGVARSGVGGTGRDRMRELSWIAILVGIVTFLYAVWKGVRAWSRRTLEKAGERVMDVHDQDDDNDEDD